MINNVSIGETIRNIDDENLCGIIYAELLICKNCILYTTCAVGISMMYENDGKNR